MSLLGDRLDHVAEIERALLLRHAGVEHDLEQEVAQFVAQVGEVAAGDGVGHLVGFFERVGRDGREILLQVPRAAGAGRAQRRHDLDQPGDVAGGLHGRKPNRARPRGATQAEARPTGNGARSESLNVGEASDSVAVVAGRRAPPRTGTRSASRSGRSSSRSGSRSPTSSCSSQTSWALRIAAATFLLSFISSRSIMRRRHEIGVVVLDHGLQLGDMADRAQRGAADLADPLGHVVGGAKDVGGLLVEQQVVVAEMRPADVPVEILGLEIERVAVGQQPVEGLGHGLDRRRRRDRSAYRARRRALRGLSLVTLLLLTGVTSEWNGNGGQGRR